MTNYRVEVPITATMYIYVTAEDEKHAIAQARLDYKSGIDINAETEGYIAHWESGVTVVEED